MGADIYLKSIFHMYSERGYFRDSYISSSLFALLGLSWWQLADELCREIDGRTVLPIDGARSLLVRLEALPVTDDRFAYWKAARSVQGWTFRGENSSTAAEWKRDFVERREQLLTMLRTSIYLNEPLRWRLS